MTDMDNGIERHCVYCRIPLLPVTSRWSDLSLEAPWQCRYTEQPGQHLWDVEVRGFPMYAALSINHIPTE
ncbi:hypothetical protein TNCV_1690801 [Trichonephila clavipes]|nr:hypothetical protein TNCV_1690801 [Trichonephila clavipes]